MDFVIIDKEGNPTKKAVVNSLSKEEALRVVKQFETDYSDVQEIEPLNYPSMFQNCIMGKS